MRHLGIYILFLILFLTLAATARCQLKNLTLMSYEIVSCNVLLEKITVNLTLKNDSADFSIKSITGLVYKNKAPLVKVTAANLYVPQGVSTIGVVCSMSRCKSVPFFKLVQCMLLFDIREYSVDVSAAVQYPNSDIQYKEQKNVVLDSFVKIR